MDLTDPNQLWSIGLSLFGAAAMHVAGRRPPVGWSLGICAQAVWLAYALHTQQWGFLLSVALYGSVYVSNVRRSLTAE